jgi:hypothetical protein
MHPRVLVAQRLLLLLLVALRLLLLVALRLRLVALLRERPEQQQLQRELLLLVVTPQSAEQLVGAAGLDRAHGCRAQREGLDADPSLEGLAPNCPKQ